MAAPMRVCFMNLFCRYHVSKAKFQSTRAFSTSMIPRRPERIDSFDPELLKILVCPISKQSLRYDPDTNELISNSIDVAYPVKNGIPNLIPADGRIIKDDPDKGSQSEKGTPV